MDEAEWRDMVQSGKLKQEINSLIWQYGHPKMTLEDAERLAVAIYDFFTKDVADSSKPHEGHWWEKAAIT